MKKKTVALLMLICAIIPCMFMLVACGKKAPHITGYKVIVKDKTYTAVTDSAAVFTYGEKVEYKAYAIFNDATLQEITQESLSITDDDGVINNTPDVGMYEVAFNYAGYSTVKVKVQVVPKSIAIPTAPDAYVYNGQDQIFKLNNHDKEAVLLNNIMAKNAGTYDVVASLKDNLNYVWEDGSITNKTIAVEILKKTVSKPTLESNELLFNFETQSPVINGLDESVINISGNTHESAAADNYAVGFALKDAENYVWEDGTSEAFSLGYKINKLKVAKPYIVAGTDKITYDGQLKNAPISGYDAYSMNMATENVQKTNVGEFAVAISLKDKASIEWAEGGTTDVVLNWEIVKATLVKPIAINHTYYYTGSAQDFKIDGINSAIQVTGGTQTDAADNYVVVVSIKDKQNYCWQDGSVADLIFNWVINKASLAFPALDASVNYFYNGGEVVRLNPSDINNFIDSAMTLGGQCEVVQVGNNYTATISIKNKNNYCWEDNTDADFVLSWSVQKAKLQKPTIKASDYVYNGTTFSVLELLEGYDNTRMKEKNDNYSQINAGVYTAKIVIVQTENYVWADGSQTEVELSWEIAKATAEFDNGGYALIVDGVYDPNKTLADYSFGRNDCRWKDPSFAPNCENSVNGFVAVYNPNPENYNDYEFVAYLSLLPIELEKPVVAGEYVFNGSEQTLVLTGFDGNLMTLEGQTAASEVGRYTVAITLKDSVNYVWKNERNQSITITWEIVAAE